MSSIVTNNALSTLFNGANATTPNIYDVVTGPKKDLTSSVLGGFTANNSLNLNKGQNNNFSALETFVKENIQGDEAAKILTSINALKRLSSFGNEGNAALDPVFSLLSSSPDISKLISPGSIIDEVA